MEPQRFQYSQSKYSSDGANPNVGFSLISITVCFGVLYLTSPDKLAVTDRGNALRHPLLVPINSFL